MIRALRCNGRAGCRKQEVVFIGMDLKESKIRAALDACLCTHIELLEGADNLKDPFAKWPAIDALLPAFDDDEAAESDTDDEREDSDDEDSDEDSEGEQDEEEEEAKKAAGTAVNLEGLLDNLEQEVVVGVPVSGGRGGKGKVSASSMQCA